MRLCIAADHPCLPGHFPGNPVVPGVVLLDEVLALLADRHGGLPGALELVQVKFLQPLLPGQQAWIELEGQAPSWSFQVRLGEAVLASGRVRLAQTA